MRLVNSIPTRILRVILLSLLVACGGDHEPDHPPIVSGLSYTPSSAMQASGATVTVAATVVFTDGGADVSAMRVKSATGQELTLPIAGAVGSAGGMATASFTLPVDQAGKLAFDVWLVDSRGSASNKLSGALDVSAPPSPASDHAPQISGLNYSPVISTQTVGSSVVVNVMVSFADPGADVSTMRIMSSAGHDITTPTPGLSGKNSGTSAASFLLALDQVGKVSFDAWVIDSRDSASNRLTGVIEVVATPPTVHVPRISALSVYPSTVTQTAGGSVVVNVSVSFSDAGADVSDMHLTSTAGADLHVAMPALNGLQSGTSAVSITLPTDNLGRYLLDVWLTDIRGSASNKMSGYVDVVAAMPSDSWARLAAAPPATLNGIGWNGERYVAVGAGGTVMTATNPSAWSVQSSGISHNLHSVAASPARWVAVGNNPGGEAVIVGSADGVAWSVLYRAGNCLAGSCATPSKLSKVNWTGSQFVAVGLEKFVSEGETYVLLLSSSDGTVWTQRAAKAVQVEYWEFPDERDLPSIAWSGSVYVMIGMNAQLSVAAWWSPDLDTWTAATIPEDDCWTTWTDVTWGMGRFVAVGAAPGCRATYSSIDGKTWLSGPVAADLPGMLAVTVGPGEYMAVGDTNRERSVNGSNWTPEVASDCGYGVIWDGKRYVSVGKWICLSP